MSYDLDGKPKKDDRRKVTNLTTPPPTPTTSHTGGTLQETNNSGGWGTLDIKPLSIQKKRRRFGELDQNADENQEVGRALGGTGQGVSKVDERNFTYSEGGWQEG